MKKGFTLAEVLITLAIIGVVAAVSIPSVISNSQQQEFKTGLRKAVSVLNSAITMNMALDGETPYDNSNLMGYLMKHMAVIKSTDNMVKEYYVPDATGSTPWRNSAFYTTDGMKFEFRRGHSEFKKFVLYENPSVYACSSNSTITGTDDDDYNCGGCGSFGLNNNQNQTTKPPCLVTVDVNGDRKPNPSNVNCRNNQCADQNTQKYSDVQGSKLTDIF
ncbi:MAG: type II secretion system protein, partial [bacterium]|nr:type II secretion system protein [bacterium]